ncbi:hypothetical protein [Cypionkella sp.]|uniref:hypothetical protein n=1 Tax=Cypionkella sp. TaxID=2811411 RepID=UPI002716CFFB|nr:hypothetical protein [Cypionkella sp.]MDO8982372.1 hypothetical protein [Cypionkella sp.]MDP1576432.1 hypothetical protein [Cypionkella sp.]MDP2050622.1 hypothetical protein [Cypionkella sp.]
MTEPAPRRCLLIAPLTFYSFHRTLAAALEKRGYQVDLLNEEFPANPLGKLMGKLALPLLRRTTLRRLKAQLDGRPSYDLVLIIKGRGLGNAALSYLHSRAQRIVGYNFDSFAFNPSARDWYLRTDRYATFDIEDAAATGLPLVHLFSAVSAVPDSPRAYNVSIIQRVHSDRLSYAKRLLEALPPGWTPFVFLYESSRLLFLLGFVRQPMLYLQLWRHISFTPLPYAKAMAALGASRVTFDYAHPRQSGITVRCFEAQGLGVAILTNNSAAVASGIFAPGAIAHLGADATQGQLRALLLDLARHCPAPQTRSVDDFFDELLAEGKSPAALKHGFEGEKA